MDNQYQNPYYQNPNQEPQAPYQVPVEQGPVSSTKALIFSAIGLALVNNVALAGLILSIIAKRMIATYEQFNGPTDYGKIKVAKILSKIGYILGLVFTIIGAVCFTIWFFIIIGALISEGGSNVHYHLASILPLIF